MRILIYRVVRGMLIVLFLQLLLFSILNDDHSIDLEFYQSIGEVEIAISQNGNVVYSSAENIDSPILWEYRLSYIKKSTVTARFRWWFLLEIKGADGAYAFGRFTVHWFDNEYITLWNKSHLHHLHEPAYYRRSHSGNMVLG